MASRPATPLRPILPRGWWTMSMVRDSRNRTWCATIAHYETGRVVWGRGRTRDDAVRAAVHRSVAQRRRAA